MSMQNEILHPPFSEATNVSCMIALGFFLLFPFFPFLPSFSFTFRFLSLYIRMRYKSSQSR